VALESRFALGRLRAPLVVSCKARCSRCGYTSCAECKSSPVSSSVSRRLSGIYTRSCRLCNLPELEICLRRCNRLGLRNLAVASLGPCPSGPRSIQNDNGPTVQQHQPDHEDYCNTIATGPQSRVLGYNISTGSEYGKGLPKTSSLTFVLGSMPYSSECALYSFGSKSMPAAF